MKLQQEQLQPVIGSDPSPEPEQLAKVETVKTDEPKLQRNEIVKITNGKETKELKYKKAQPLIEAGEWKII
jgi:preprotein translocase subunit SecA